MIFYSPILLMFTPACVRLTALHGCSLLFIHIPHLCVVQRQPGSMVVWWADDNKMLVELVFYNPSDIQPVRIVSGRFYFPSWCWQWYHSSCNRNQWDMKTCKFHTGWFSFIFQFHVFPSERFNRCHCRQRRQWQCIMYNKLTIILTRR